MERTLKASGNAGDWKEWQKARREYRNMLVIEKAATGNGADTALGLISPSQLRNATVQQGRRAYARGQGDFADLARSGEAIMKPLPNSGTAPRLKAQNLGLTGHAVPLGIGGAIGGMVGGPVGAAIGGAAGLAIPRLAGRLALTAPVRNYLTNQRAAPGLPGSSLSPIQRALLFGAMRQ